MPATSKKLGKTQDRITPRVRLRRILFATDFSASANVAMPFAAKPADSFGARLFVLHVRNRSTTRSRRSVGRDWKRPGLLSPQMLKSEGTVWSEIAEAVRKNDIDLVVIGTPAEPDSVEPFWDCRRSHTDARL